MRSFPLLPLGLLALLLGAATPGRAADPKPAYRPLAGADQLKRGESLKPRAGNVDLPPIVLETRVHYHADGSARYECAQAHGEIRSAAAAAERSR